MMKILFGALVCVASVVVVVSFFLPWATVSVSAIGVSEGLIESLAGTPVAGKILGKLSSVTDAISNIGDFSVKNTVSGYQIPVMVNDESSKVAISLAQMFFEDAKDLDKKSYLVYLLPVLGVLCALLAFIGGKNRFFIMLMVLLSGAVGIGGLYKLITLDVSSLMVKITIMEGLWYAMYSFIFICVVGIVWLIVDNKTPVRRTA